MSQLEKFMFFAALTYFAYMVGQLVVAAYQFCLDLLAAKEAVEFIRTCEFHLPTELPAGWLTYLLALLNLLF